MSKLIEIDAHQMAAAEALLVNVKNGAERAISKSVNEGLKFARKKIVDAIGDTFYFSKQTVRNKSVIEISPATVNRLSGSVISQGYRLPLYNFATNPRTVRRVSTLRAAVKRDGGLKAFSHGFIAKMPSGHVGLFTRLPGNRRSDKTGNYKIRERYGNSVPQLMDAVLRETDDIEQAANDIVEQALESQVSRLLNGGRR
jgi:hypothetical protein